MIDGYVAVGYGLIWAVVLGYAWRTHRRLRDVERALGETSESAAAKHTGTEGT